jgi:O-antigen/teichoic acid export membrane protein
MDDDELPQYSKEVAKGSLWSFIGNILSKLVSFFYVILLARSASQDDVGLFYLSYSIIGLVMVFSDLGLPGSLQRYVPYFEGRKEPGKISSLFKATYVLVTLSSLVFMGLVWWQADSFAASYHNPGLADALRFIVPFVLIGSAFRINTIYLQGRADIRAMQYIINLQNFLKLVLTLALFYFFGASLFTISLAFTLSHLLAIIASVFPLRRVSGSVPPSAAPISRHEMLREIIPFGFMLSILSSFTVIIASSDRILLGYLSPAQDANTTVAIYAIATTLASLLTTLPLSIELIFLPLISRMVGMEDMDSVRKTTQTAMRWTILVTIPVAIVMMLFSSDMLGVLYGDSYRPGALAMAIVTLAFLVRTYASMMSLTLAALRRVELELRVYLAVAVLNIALNALLIPAYGMDGSALATLASFALMLVLFYHYSRRIFGFSFHSGIFKITAAGAIAFILVLAASGPLSSLVSSLPQPGSGEFQAYASKLVYLAYLGILTGLALGIFGLSSLALRCISREDVVLMRRAMLKAKVPMRFVDLAQKVASLGVDKAA